MMTKRATFTKGLVAGAGATALAGALVFAAPLGATEDTKADDAASHHEVYLDEQPRLEALIAKIQADKVEFLEAVAAHLAAEKAAAEQRAAEQAAAAKAAAEQAAALKAARAAATPAPAKAAFAEGDRRWGCDKDGDGVEAARAGHGGWDGDRHHDGWDGDDHDGYRKDGHHKGGGWRR